ncbi:sporulation protein, partial [Streptomyces sp. TRM76130]|nr:sporulation protein [Streptomyces sp. TRM76130]
LAHPGGLEVVLEADKRGGFFTEGHDVLTRFTVGHHDTRDWNTEVDGWIRELIEHRASYASHASYAPYGHHGHEEHHDGHHSGPGIG